MAGRDPGEATHTFLDSLRRAVSCVCPDVLIVSGYGPRPEPNAVSFDRRRPARLQGDARLLLRVRIEFVYVQTADHSAPWKVSIVGYWYSIETSEEQDLVAYHWHPNAPGEHTSPHLHIGHAAQIGYAPIAGAHLPTGPVALESVLRLAISDLGVEPRRADWREVLDETQSTSDVARRTEG